MISGYFTMISGYFYHVLLSSVLVRDFRLMETDAVTCAPIAWQLAQDSLSAKYGSPFYSIISGHIKSVKEPKCDGDGWKDLAYELNLEGMNLLTSKIYEDIFVRIDVSEDAEYCSDPAFKIPPFPSGKHIFFLETEMLLLYSLCTLIYS